MPPATTDPTIAATRQRVRDRMPITAKWAYFDHAAVAPLSGPAVEATQAWIAQASQEGDTVWPQWAKRLEQVRRTAAGMIGASADEIALVTNTTAGINLVAEGLDWREGDNVVIPAGCFPSNVYPWMQQADRGVEVRCVPTDNGRIDLDTFRALCDERTRVVSVSWVDYKSGYRQPLDAIADIAHSTGANDGAGTYFFLDAIQGLGVYPLDLAQTPIDFLAADGHKWMLGPEGAGVAYVRAEHLDKLRARGVGWGSVPMNQGFDTIELNLKPAASRYEGGSANMVGQIAFGASLDLLTEEPTERIAASILDLTDYLCDRLPESGARVASVRAVEPNGHDPRSGIVSVETPGSDPTAVRARLMEAGVVTMVRGGRLRMSPHAYTSYDEADRLVDALSTCLAGTPS